jgi:5-methylcytosine-specific restriction endonuclease McrA
MVPCEHPNCEREFSTDRGMKVHHKKAHGESLVQNPCDHCGDLTRGTFCSNQCQHEYRQENDLYDEYFDIALEGDDNPTRRAEVREKMSESISALHSADDSPYDEQWKQKVANEGEANGMYGYEFSDEELEEMSERLQGREPSAKGEDHHWYKHGRHERKVPFGDNWSRQRKKALEQADYECERCGISHEELQRDSRIGLTVHHEVPRRFVYHHPFMSIEDDANQVSNLTALCRSCHNIVEQAERGNFRWRDEY